MIVVRQAVLAAFPSDGPFDLDIAQGERVAVLGPTQRLLTGLVRACVGLEGLASGQIVVDGLDVGQASRRELQQLRARAGYVSVHGGLLSNLSVKENLETVLIYHGSTALQAERRALSLLEQHELLEHRDRRVAAVSRELQKCVAYLRAIVRGPNLFFAEDPSAHLSPRGREIVTAVHGELAGCQATVLVADDDEAFARTLVARERVL